MDIDGEGSGTAVDMPVAHVRPRASRVWPGDVLAFVGGGIAAGLGWIGRRVYVAIPAVALTVVPLVHEPIVEASEPSFAQGVLVATAEPLYMEDEPLIQSPRTKPQPKPAKQPTGPSGPTQPKTKPHVLVNAPSVQQLAELYTRTGRALKDAADKDKNATLDLWPRYRWVNFMEAIKTPQKRAEAAAVLEKLLADTKKVAP